MNKINSDRELRLIRGSTSPASSVTCRVAGGATQGPWRGERELYATSSRAVAADFHIETLRRTADLHALESEWRALETRLPAIPFVSYDWNVAWWQHLRERKLGVTDELAVKTFRSTNGTLCAVAPLMLTRRPGIGPMRLRQLQFFGADPNMTEIRGIAVPDGLRHSVYDALLKELQRERASWDWLEVTGLPGSQDSVGLVEQHFPGAKWLPDVSDHLLQMAPTWVEFKGNLSRNIRESLRKCYNAPKRDGISISLNDVRSGSEVARAVETFLCLHRARSEFTGTIQHRNVFATESTRQFLLDVCQRFAARDALRIFQLNVEGKVVATRIGFILFNSLYLYYSGYDSAFAKYSVMTTVLAEAIQSAIVENLDTVNLSTGTDTSKERWSPRHVAYKNALIVSPCIRGRLTHYAYAMVRSGLEKLPAAAQLRAQLSRRS